MHKYLILIFIVIIGAVLRFTFLDQNPPSLNWDEVSHGYNAYSILKTGMDQWGQKLPLINFRAYGDYPTALNLYLTIPFILAFGLTEFAIRFPHALLGVLTIISSYFLVWGLTKKKSLSLLTAFLVAVTPWYIFTSRFVLQSNLSVFLLTTSLAFFFNREKKKYYVLVSILLLFLTLFSYHTTRIFSPLFLLGMVVIYRNYFSKPLVAIFFATTVLIFISPTTWARSNVLSIINESSISKIEELRNTSKLPDGIKRLAFNRPTYFAGEFIKNYVSYFSPKFLFLEGGTQYQFSVPKMGLLYLVSLPFFYLGIYLLIKKSLKEKDYRLLLLWLILAPIPASMTNEKLTVIRATTMLPITEVLTAAGVIYLLNKVSNKVRTIGLATFVIAVLISLGIYLQNYMTSYKKDYSWSWQYGYKEVVTYVQENYDEYDKVIMTKKYGEPHEYFLFFLKWDPAKYQNDGSAIRFFQSDWWWVDRFDKFYFINDWQVKEMKLESGGEVDCTSQKCLLITSPGNNPQDWSKLDTIDFLDGKPAFEIYANQK
jgi:4-amino-4-deoxy-L-arabinose transferase-like glycosyltransferase